jgi:ketosteroid isomerase-like protein
MVAGEPEPLTPKARRQTPLASQPHGVDTVHMTDEQVLEQLERDWVDALRRGDGDTLDRIWDRAFVFTDPRGHSLSRDDCLRDIRAGALRMGEAEVRRLRVHVFGDTAVVVGTIALRGVAGTTAYDGEYSFVDVYARRQGQWRAVLSTGDVAGTLMA